MKKTFKVVILSTNKIEDSQLMLQGSNKKLSISHPNCHNVNSNNIWQGQHLYILSDDEIKEGDWVYDNYRKALLLAPNKNNVDFFNMTSNRYKKIVTTTDKSLYYESTKDIGIKLKGLQQLAQLPESFIKAYIKAYNEGNPITEVDLELEANTLLEDGDDLSQMWKIKTRQDNTVIIHQSKMYTKNEVVELLELMLNHHTHSFNNFGWLKKWIEKNL